MDIEVDLMGQCVAEMVGHRLVGAIGWAVEREGKGIFVSVEIRRPE